MAVSNTLDQDLYRVLGVPHDCSHDALRRAYRRLAREHHPDTNAGCKAAERRFKEIGAAYAVLSDSSRRARYDLTWLRHGAAPTSSSPGRRRGYRDWPHPSDQGGSKQETASPAGAGGAHAEFGPWSALWWSPMTWSTAGWMTAMRYAHQGPLWWPHSGPPDQAHEAGRTG